MNWTHVKPADLTYDETLDSFGRLLSLACRARRTDAERDELRHLVAMHRLDDIRRFARQNGVEWIVADAIALELGDDRLDETWRLGLQQNEARVQRIIDELTELGAAFDAARIRWAVTENAGVLLASDQPLRAFCAGDFDLLFAPDDHDAARAVLAARGYRSASRARSLGTHAEFGRVPPDGGPEICFNVGVVPFDRQWMPFDYRDRTGPWLERRRPSPRASGLWILKLEDALTHVAVHTSVHAYVRAPFLRLYVDVDRLAADNAVEATACERRRPKGATTATASAEGVRSTGIQDNMQRNKKRR